MSATDTNPFRYCAEYFDLETGQIYLRNRYYQPVTGRFSQLDPIRDGLNWYAYCANNPILFVDPSGLQMYIFYSEEFEVEMRQQRDHLVEKGYNYEDITMLVVYDSEDFKNKWNDFLGIRITESGDCENVEIENIVIMMHGTPTRLYTSESDFVGSGRIAPKLSSQFKDVTVTENVMLLSCSAGNLDYKNNNIASAIAKRVNGAPVLASDSTVLKPIGKNDYKFTATKKSDSFAEYSPNRSQSEGWVVYRYNSNTKEITTRSLGYAYNRLTINNVWRMAL